MWIYTYQHTLFYKKKSTWYSGSYSGFIISTVESVKVGLAKGNVDVSCGLKSSVDCQAELSRDANVELSLNPAQ